MFNSYLFNLLFLELTSSIHPQDIRTTVTTIANTTTTTESTTTPATTTTPVTTTTPATTTTQATTTVCKSQPQLGK